MKKAIFITLALLVITLVLLFYLKKDDFSVVKSKNNQILTTQQDNGQVYFKITFLDIGQGDASFIEWPNGQQMLIDCAKDSRILEALGRVMSYYDKQIDYLVVTHPDLDHYGGCIDVLKRFDVKNIIYTGLQKDNKSWEVFWQTIAKEEAKYYEIRKTQKMQIAEAELYFLYPDHDIRKDSFKKDNNSSLILKFSYGETDVLFTGDAEVDLENYLINNFPQELDVEVLKVGHHGSGSSSSQEFLDLVTPEMSTISVGGENKYGHPSRRVIKRLERANSKILRTDLAGDIVLRIYANSVEIE